MQPIVGNVAALAVAVIYYLWRDRYMFYHQQQRLLRQRVAYMLWVVAEQLDQPDEPLAVN